MCRHCARGVPLTSNTPKLYGSREALWSDRLFAELLGGGDKRQALPSTLARHCFGQGKTSDYPPPVDGGRVRGVEAVRGFPLRRESAPVR